MIGRDDSDDGGIDLVATAAVVRGATKLALYG